MKLLFAGVLMSALCIGFIACDKPDIPVIEKSPLGDNPVFVRTTPGEEAILFAKGGISDEESESLYANFKSEYGEGNVHPTGGITVEEHISCQDYNVFVDPEAVPDLYEITMTIEFPESSVPSIKSLLGHGFSVVRIDGCTAICKQYWWAFTQEGADTLISICEKLYNRACEYEDPEWEVELNRLYSGTIIGTSAIKNLGPEVHNEPVIF